MTVEFEGTKNIMTVYGLWQYDYGQTLVITGLTGLSAAQPVHFALDGAATAEIRTGAYADGVLTVAIPDVMLEQTGPFWAYIYQTDGTQGKTIKAVRFDGIHERGEPDDGITPENKSTYDQLVEQLNALIATVDGVNNAAAVSAGEAAQSAEDAGQSAQDALNNILNGVSTHNASDAAHADIREDIRTVESIARGRATSYTFDTLQQLQDWLAGTYTRADGKVKADLVSGDNLWVVDLSVPDYWWDGDTQAIKPLKAENPDLTEYYTKAQVDALVPLPIEQTPYDALVSAGTVEAGKIYYTVPDGTLS